MRLELMFLKPSLDIYLNTLIVFKLSFTRPHLANVCFGVFSYPWLCSFFISVMFVTGMLFRCRLCFYFLFSLFIKNSSQVLQTVHVALLFHSSVLSPKYHLIVIICLNILNENMNEEI